MPFGDGSGPWGMGPLIGRRLGNCAEFPTSGAFGRGCGFGCGQRRGLRHRYWATGMPGWAGAQGGAQVDEAKILKQQAAYLKARLEDTQACLAKQENKTDDEGKDK